MSHDPNTMSIKFPPQACPRCGDWIPNNLRPGAYPGALSRTDNKTEICSECGTLEAMEQHFSADGLMPQSEWLSQPKAEA